MKKLSWLTVCNLLLLYFCLSCSLAHNHNISIHVSDSEHDYKMSARFDEQKTRNVEEYMDYKIGRRSNMSFVNTRIDGQIALDDHTTFYIKKYPGYLEIKLNKDKNSYNSYHEIKTMCEGIKNVIK